jgi:hypothetical protein
MKRRFIWRRQAAALGDYLAVRTDRDNAMVSDLFGSAFHTARTAEAFPKIYGQRSVAELYASLDVSALRYVYICGKYPRHLCGARPSGFRIALFVVTAGLVPILFLAAVIAILINRKRRLQATSLRAGAAG